MSEIKITKDSLENAILKNGQFVSGYVDNGGNRYISASGYGAHAEGFANSNGPINASGNGAHAEGISTNALANGAHAEGYLTTASANYSYAGGKVTIANQEAMTAIGKYNKIYDATDISTLFVVGNGTANRKSNAFEVINNTSTSVRATVNGIKNVELGLPIGSVTMWAGNDSNIPEGWFLCDGAGIPVYSSLEVGYKTLACKIQGKELTDDELHNFAFKIISTEGLGHFGQAQLKKYNVNNKWIQDGTWFDNNTFIVSTWTDDCQYAQKFYSEPHICNRDIEHEITSDVSTFLSILLPNLQQRFPIGAKIGGVGNIIDKGTLKLYYSSTLDNWYYEGPIEIGQFLDLTSVQTILPHTGIYSDYCKIIDILGPNSISVIKCDSSGKTIDNTINNLFNYYLYTIQQSITVDDIKIKGNEYSTVLGSTGGEATHSLSLSELPGDPAFRTPHDGSNDTYFTYGFVANPSSIPADKHNNIPPFLAINFIIKYK